MITWVMYDIEQDKARTKIAKYCQQAGLYRVQYSVFLGSISDNERDSLTLQIEQLIDPNRDKVYIFSMSQRALKSSTLLGQAFDQRLVTDQVKALFF